MNPLRPSAHEFRLDLPDPPEVVFEWHRRPGAFSRLVPPWQPVRVVRETDDLAAGTAVLAFPAGRRWVAAHLPGQFVEQRRFTDELASRPFVLPVSWRHRHDFEPGEGGGTEVVDEVTTTVPRRLLEPMFAYRHRQLRGDLAVHRAFADAPRLTVAITGASGLVGSALSAFLSTGGHTVVRLVRRRPSAPGERAWEPAAPDPAELEGVDAVVHLAGHGIAGRFTERHKEQIRSSRVGPTRLLAAAAAAAGIPTFVSASAIGYYGSDRGDEELTEDALPGDDFLARVVRDWEDAAHGSGSDRMRVVTVRTGIVQSPRGGALAVQRPLFAAGLGGPMGSGLQWQSWIGIDDLIAVYHRALLDSRVAGPVNAVAPGAVRQREYATVLGRVLHRPSVLPTPALGPRLLLGSEGARDVALASQRVVPRRLQDLAHRFAFADVETALGHVLGRLPDPAQEPGS